MSEEIKRVIKKLQDKRSYRTPKRVKELMARTLARCESMDTADELEKNRLILQGGKWLLDSMRQDSVEKRMDKLEKAVKQALEAPQTPTPLTWYSAAEKTAHKPTLDV